MVATTAITAFTLNDGTTVEVPENGVVLFVGPNNAGKSQALRDLRSLTVSSDQQGVVISAVDVEYRGNGEELIARLKEDRSIIKSPQSGEAVDLGEGGIQSVATVSQMWQGGAPYIVARYFVALADTESRLNASRPVEAVDLFAGNPYHPLHWLYQSPQLEDRLNSISRDAFGRGLILDSWSGGMQWAIRVGDIERPSSPRPDQGYLDALKTLPLLHEQGDGVRSMIGLLLGLLTGHQSISLVDEPEAFLHPPQARFLAKLLAGDSTTEGRSAFLSTHSSEIVHGTLEGGAPTTVVRLQRKGDLNTAAVLDNAAVRRLWSDPLLRYSNLLEGLFTDAVIVCESDADCKFFASIRDTLESSGEDSRRPDILFTSCGGKHRMRVAVSALRAASVPVVAIGDFDVLNDWGTLSRLIESAGGDPQDFDQDWRTLNGALVAGARTPSVAGMREAVSKAFDDVSEVTQKSLEPVRQALKIDNGWDRVKNTGLAGVPKGAAYEAAVRLLDALAQYRIFLIPVGEMEDFVPAASGHGPAWLSDVLERRLHVSDAGGAQKFLERVLASVADSHVLGVAEETAPVSA